MNRRRDEDKPPQPGNGKPPATKAVAGRLPGAGRGRGHGGWGSMGMPAEKAMDFRPSAKRLIGRLAPERARMVAVLVLTVSSVGLSVVGPKILGHATNIIFAGAVGEKLPAGASKAQIVAHLRQTGHPRQADLIGGINLVPGVGIDFTRLGRVLLLVLALYLGASLLMWAQGYLLNDAVQTTVQRLRDDVEGKINRLPLSYFDTQPRGELLSRVTNDISNIQHSLQQTLSQLLSSLLTVIGVLVMMFLVSSLLTVIALVTIPLVMIATGLIAKRSQKQFIAQWTHTGTLTAQVEEAFTGQDLVRVFGRHRDIEERFRAKNDELYDASFKAQFMSGIIMPTVMFLGNLNYVAVAVVGGLRVAYGDISLG
ncbi:MAG: ABC transporter ATP-binding protein, partial [Sciscionella sp.]